MTPVTTSLSALLSLAPLVATFLRVTTELKLFSGSGVYVSNNRTESLEMSDEGTNCVSPFL